MTHKMNSALIHHEQDHLKEDQQFTLLKEKSKDPNEAGKRKPYFRVSL